MVEHIERETVSEGSLEVRLEEVVSLLEEIPSMIKLDTAQLRKLVCLIFGAESIVDSGCHKDGSRANGTGDELIFLTGDEIQNGRVESGHGVVRDGERRGHDTRGSVKSLSIGTNRSQRGSILCARVDFPGPRKIEEEGAPCSLDVLHRAEFSHAWGGNKSTCVRRETQSRRETTEINNYPPRPYAINA